MKYTNKKTIKNKQKGGFLIEGITGAMLLTSAVQAGVAGLGMGVLQNTWSAAGTYLDYRNAIDNYKNTLELIQRNYESTQSFEKQNLELINTIISQYEYFGD